MRTVFAIAALSASLALVANARDAAVLAPEYFRPHVEFFNRMLPEAVVNHVPDARAWEWLEQNVPYFACPDKEVEQMYYYRWWDTANTSNELPPASS
jgi:hypothetical protein